MPWNDDKDWPLCFTEVIGFTLFSVVLITVLSLISCVVQ